MIHGEQKEPESERLDGRQSPPPALAESRRLASVSIDSMNLPGELFFLHFSNKAFSLDISKSSMWHLIRIVMNVVKMEILEGEVVE